MDKSNISVPLAEYTSATNFTINQKPPFSGSSELAICGTDGLQFTPELNRGGELSFFSSEWSRNVGLQYTNTTDDYAGIEMLNYVMKPSMWEKSEKYDTMIGGTMNVTEVLGSQAFVAKGRYCNIDPNEKESIPKILDTTGRPLDSTGCSDADESYIGVEAHTGITLILK